MTTDTQTLESGVAVNSDGLYVMYGPAASRDAVAGSALVFGDDQILTLSLDYARLPAFSANEALGVIYGSLPNAAIPDGAIIKSAIITVDTAFSTGSSPTLSVGLVTIAGSVVTEVDNDGLLDAVTLSTAGTVNTGAGALINTKLAAGAPCYVWVTVQTASYTAGHGRLQITYYMPTDELQNH